MEIREATPDDAAAIARVHVDSWIGAYRGIVPDEILDNLSVDRRTEGWTRMLTNGDVWAFVAEEVGVVRGFVGCGSIERPEGDDEFAGLDPNDTAELTTIYIDPRWWGRGIGQALMDVAVADLRKREFTSAVLWVLAENDRARRFYESGGWRVDGARKECFGRAVPPVEAPAVRYRLDL